MRNIKIPCPICGFSRLIDSDENVKSETKALSDIKNGWKPDYIQKCPQCKSQIGIRKIE